MCAQAGSECGTEPAQIQLLIEALGGTEDFLLSPRRDSVELEQCHFRSLRASTQTIKKSIASQAELFELLVNELEQEVDSPPPGGVQPI